MYSLLSNGSEKNDYECVKDGYTNMYICVWCVTIYCIFIIKCVYMDRDRWRETDRNRDSP